MTEIIPRPTRGLSVRDLTVSGPAGVLVNAISLDLAPGERLGIIGESGSGKSLTALAILGLLPAGVNARGSVWLDGQEILGASARTLNGIRGRKISTVFQEPLTALDPLMRIGAQLAWPLKTHQHLRGERLTNAIRTALTEVALAEPDRLARARIPEISGGQRQRVAIALALSSRPSILIADEPTTALDLGVQAEILDLVDRTVTDRAMSLLLISHDLAVISRMTQKILVLREGTMVEYGPAARILTAPDHDYTRLLVDTARTLEAFLPPRAPSITPEEAR